MSVRVRTGIDVIEIDRISAALDRWSGRFLHRVFTDREILDCRGSAQSLAGRFAAKEAASKALGLGISTIGWQDIEVVRGPRGEPCMLLKSKAAAVAAELRLCSFEVSISHSRTDAIAVVVAWGDS